MFLKKMKILNFIRKKVNNRNNQTIKKKFDLDMKKKWLEGDGPQTD